MLSLTPLQPLGLPHPPCPWPRHHLQSFPWFHPAWSIPHRAAGWLSIIRPCPFRFPAGPSLWPVPPHEVPALAKPELLCSLSTSCFPMSPYPCTSCSSIFFLFSPTWCLLSTPQVSAQTLLPLDPKPGQQPLLCSHNACASPATALVCFLFPKGHMLLSRDLTPRLVLDQVTRLCPSSHTQRP